MSPPVRYTFIAPGRAGVAPWAPLGAGTITLTAGELVIAQNLTIVGPDPRQLRISGKKRGRVLSISAGAVVRLDKVTITQGYAPYGGGINNAGTLTLRQSTLSRNTAGYAGGGIHNVGTVTLWQSTLSGNTAGAGGGIDNWGTVTLRQSTVSRNTAEFHGGGLYNMSLATLVQSTVSANTAGDQGGGFYNSANLITLYTTIVAGNTAGSLEHDCAQFIGGRPAIVRSRGYNLIGTATRCLWERRPDDVFVDPAIVFMQVLKPLEHNGGVTKTHALRPGSPAMNAGDPGRCGGTDQRGVARPQGMGCDIGAFALEVVP